MGEPNGWAGGKVESEEGAAEDEGCPEPDAEGVWSPDIELSFQEALAIYPPCGRRKIILSDEGKMYGRNELIARYIKLRTGKTRTRKQVSSHIQVLARRKSREIQSKLKTLNVDQVAKDKALQSLSAMSSAQLIAAPVLTPPTPPNPGPHASEFFQFWPGPGSQPLSGQDGKQFPLIPAPCPTLMLPPTPMDLPGYDSSPPGGLSPSPGTCSSPGWQGRVLGTPRLQLVEFSAFVEVPDGAGAVQRHLFVHISQDNSGAGDTPLESVDVRQIYDKFPEKKGGLRELYERGPPNAFFLVKFWADLNSGQSEEPGRFYGVTSLYESPEDMTVTCSSKVCSFGKQVVEKVETERARPENGRFVFQLRRSPMCEYLVNFVHKLQQLPERYMMNSVLENFTILQVVTNRDTQELLLCTAYVFEVSTSEHGAQHHIYRLIKD
ncbi:transcriptional enhancer factor TEF-4 isoform X2 [Tachyglossus aculeatus]|uniref:transcriptional enhancer factor TEF-4 isoform X2 n=1 Tax=Tachyglossus aculeatus TaxID=9261 RepID=UPI0018F6FEFC|nr:transcriptional enhancer factor TEF-4 isoform X2 [Tachyglossus aculeatus]